MDLLVSCPFAKKKLLAVTLSPKLLYLGLRGIYSFEHAEGLLQAPWSLAFTDQWNSYNWSCHWSGNSYKPFWLIGWSLDHLEAWLLFMIEIGKELGNGFYFSFRGEPKSGAVKIFLLQSLCWCILPSLIHMLTVEKCPQCNSVISEKRVRRWKKRIYNNNCLLSAMVCQTCAETFLTLFH